MKLWIARDSNNALWFHNLKPRLEHNPILNIYYWISRGNYYEVDQDLFPEVTYENSPMEVELVIKKKYDTGI